VDNRARQQIEGHLRFLERLGTPLKRGATVLDFGCGHGAAVRALRDMGYDAYGVDVWPWWTESGQGSDHLRQIDPTNNLMPFSDGFFDFCFSDQVFEHVFNYPAAFREIGRLLKPGAISVHRFPGPNTLIDGHTNLPFPVFCHYRAYVAAWAIAGRRAPGQMEYGWRQTLDVNTKILRGVNYPTKRRLRRDAEAAGVSITFLEARELDMRETGSAAAIKAQADRYGLRRLAVTVMSLFVQRYMVLARAS
jgi:SAM-dependent methyltransferase